MSNLDPPLQSITYIDMKNCDHKPHCLVVASEPTQPNIVLRPPLDPNRRARVGPCSLGNRGHILSKSAPWSVSLHSLIGIVVTTRRNTAVNTDYYNHVPNIRGRSKFVVFNSGALWRILILCVVSYYFMLHTNNLGPKHFVQRRLRHRPDLNFAGIFM